jgi:hypothetical protein
VSCSDGGKIDANLLVINSLQNQLEQVWRKLGVRLANARLKFERQMRFEE